MRNKRAISLINKANKIPEIKVTYNNPRISEKSQRGKARLKNLKRAKLKSL
jgi:hypothetical protein